MKHRPHRAERFLRDPLPIQWGGIAANLARVASFAENPPSQPVVASLLHESKFFIEWAAPAAPIETAAVLVELQIALARWQDVWSENHADPATRDSIVEFARDWSSRVLAMSGLLVEASAD